MKHNYFTDTIFCTLFVFIFLGVTYFTASHFDLFKPLSATLGDFEMTDIIYSRRENADGSSYNLRDDYVVADTNIILVNIGQLDRRGIAAQVNIVNEQQPKLIAIDTIFERASTHFADSMLADALSKVQNLIVGTHIYQSKNSMGEYDSLATVYAPFYANAQIAYLNFSTSDAAHKYEVSRVFSPEKRINDSLTLPAFATQIAKVAYPEAYQKLQKRNRSEELINFRCSENQYTTLDINDIFNPELNISFKDKVVILGYMGPYLGSQSWEVKYFTPLNEKYIGKTAPDMFEIGIHANIVSMIYEGGYIKEMPKWLCILIGVFLCAVNITLFLWINKWLPRWYDAITKTIQFFEIIILLYVVLLVFSHFSYKIDLTLGLTALLFAGDLLEIYVAVVKNIAMHIKHKVSRPIIENINPD